MPPAPEPSPLKRQAAEALRRARKLPIGPDRNDLRQLAIGLLWLERNGARRSAAAGRPVDGEAKPPRNPPG